MREKIYSFVCPRNDAKDCPNKINDELCWDRFDINCINCPILIVMEI